MNTASPTWTPPANARGRGGALTPLVLLVAGAATAAAAVVGNGSLVITLVPFALAVGTYVLWVAPIRYTLFVLTFVCLGLDARGDGPWDSPLAPVGLLFTANLANSVHVPVPLSASALLLGALLVIHIHRRLSGSEIDGRGRSETPTPLLWALGVSVLAVIALSAYGRLRGGDLQMAKNQVQSFVQLLLVAYLAAMSLRGTRDYRTLGRIIVAAACLKAVMAVYVSQTVVPAAEFATSHGDSLLFACAMVLLMVRFAEQPGRRRAAVAAIVLPILAAGMVANDRRLVWVQVAAALLVFWAISRRTRVKRYLARALLVALPFYVIVGWNSSSSLFAPIQTFRTVGGNEADKDGSTLYRETENYNLLQTMRLNPFLGTGFGQPFLIVVAMPDISFFKEYRYQPHNSILGLFAYTGALGFTAIFAAFVAAAYFAGRSYAFARSSDERVAACMVLAMIMIHAIHCWGDIGFAERRSIYLVGPALAIAGQLATATGAWRTRSNQQHA